VPNRFDIEAITCAEDLLRLPHDEAIRYIAGLQEAALNMSMCWPFWQRADQREPPAPWRIWLVLAGRGYGKTRMGAEWVHERAQKFAGSRIALVGSNIGEARAVMIEGDSGLLSLHGAYALDWQPSLKRINWPNGSQATLFSAAEAEGLRGPQHHFAWADEIAKWTGGDTAWNNLRMGLRLGDKPQIIATTTPRPVALIRRLIGEEGVIVTRGRTGDNRANLAPDFLSAMRSLYAGTRLGRQELEGELIEELQGALWSRAMIEQARVKAPPDMRRIVVGVDPPISTGGDACGIVIAAVGADEKAYILADCSVESASPETWARAVSDAADIWQADRVVAEANQGGAMVESTLRAANVALPVKLVYASRGKSARAEPVAALFEAGRAKFAGAYPALEDQLCGMIAGGGYEGPGRSPDRADAAVWALTELMLGKTGTKPRVRMF